MQVATSTVGSEALAAIRSRANSTTQIISMISLRKVTPASRKKRALARSAVAVRKAPAKSPITMPRQQLSTTMAALPSRLLVLTAARLIATSKITSGCPTRRAVSGSTASSRTRTTKRIGSTTTVAATDTTIMLTIRWRQRRIRVRAASSEPATTQVAAASMLGRTRETTISGRLVTRMAAATTT